MPGPNSGMMRRWRRAGQAAFAAAVVAALGLASGIGTPAEARRKITGPETPPSHAPAELFGVAAKAYPPARNFAKWNDALARYERERRTERALCKRGDCALQRWREFLATIKHAPRPVQLKAVNDYFNRLPYVADMENYGVEDHWATPREFFAKGGDCEDYAIAKYLSLRALGWPAERLRIVVVHDRERDLVHAALVAYHGGTGHLLDIEIPEVTDQRRVARYQPIFAIGETGWWSFNPSPLDMARPADVKPVGAMRPAAVGKLPLGKIEADSTLDPGERTEEIFAPGAR